MMEERSKTIAFGAVSGLFGKFVALISPLIATPIIYNYFGDSNYGIWISSISITSMLVVMDFGIGSSLLTILSKSLGMGDAENSKKYIYNAYCIAKLISIVAVPVFLIMIGVIERQRLDLNDTQYYLLSSVVVVFFLGMPYSIIHQILYAAQKMPTSSAVMTLGALSGLVLCIVGVTMKAPVWVVAVAYSAPSVLINVLGAAYFFHIRPELFPIGAKISRSHMVELFRLGSHFLLLSILMAASLNIDNIIIAMKAGTEAVAAYAIPARLGSVLSLVVMTIFMPLWAANSDAIAKGEFEWVRRSALRMSVIGIVIVALSGGLLLLVGDQLISLWVGKTFESQSLTLASVIVGALIVAATSPYNMLLNALGRADLQIIPWAAFAIISIPAKMLLVAQGRVWMAAALTAIIYGLVITPLVIMCARRELGRALAKREKLVGMSI